MGGIGRAAWDLAAEMAAQRGPHRISILKGPRAPKPFKILGAEIINVMGAMIDERFEQLELPVILESLGADLYLNPTFSVPAVQTTPLQISIIHDVVFEDRPEWVEPGLREYLRRSARFAAAEATHVITVSDHARRRIGEIYNLPENRVTRIYNGIRKECFLVPSAGEIETLRQKRGLRDPFILYLGSIEPKKGVPELLAAFSILTRSGFRGILALAGGKSGPLLDFEGIVRRLGLTERVRWLGYIAEDEKKSLLSACDLFVYPSLYEGFGIPPLEAMALGTPCVVSGETSLPEIVGEAALVAEVKSPESLAGALGRALSDTEFRRRARTQGPARAGLFSWERSAKETLDLCERLGAA
jgi:glycosyltransferase involved in cell wall biosynthesis